MSAQTPVPQKRITAPEIASRKGREPIVSLTSYHAHTAAIADPFVDLLLVGDSLGMVMHGYESTVPVPLELMIMHGRAVVRGAKRALVVVDMPFGSYEESPSVAFRNAAHVMKETGCGAIKLEGGRRMAETIRFLTERGIPGDGPHRPHPAVDQRAGRLQDAGPRARRVGGHRGGRQGRRRGRRLLGRARGHGRGAGAQDHRRHSHPHHRHRRVAPAATARSW